MTCNGLNLSGLLLDALDPFACSIDALVGILQPRARAGADIGAEAQEAGKLETGTRRHEG
ncbi:hypothetical protein C2U69_28270 [Cupriavidus pinatubonensis]|nr:hypothetical protein C2U69_28270 [Cupriavidus pinatubonensis]